MPGRNRYARETAPRRAHRNNLWIRLDKNKWFTPDEYTFRFGEEPQKSQDSRVELLCPLPFMHQGRQIVRKKISEGKTAAEVLLAFDKLCEFEDKLLANQYRPLPVQEEKVEWPDPELPPKPKAEPAPIPEYNDLVNERAEIAEETIKQKTQEAIKTIYPRHGV